ncbi:hypothetical protein LOC67_14120 [Stieleria sp. JC731]|nr:hypothetical protein [Stieleria sp. JC731]
MFVSIAALVFDGGVGMSEHLNLQHAADTASTAAAASLHSGNDATDATDIAREMVSNGQGMNDANITVNIPPSSGRYAGENGYVEVIAERQYDSIFSGYIDGALQREMKATSVSGIVSNPNGAALAILDPDPADISFSNVQNLISNIDRVALVEEAVDQLDTSILQIGPLNIPSVLSGLLGLLKNTLGDTVSDLLDTELLDPVSAICPPLLTLTGGLEIEGLGQLRVNGAVHVNNKGGRVDRYGRPAGKSGLPPYGISCMPLVSTTRLAAKHIYVAGGVDSTSNYCPYDSGGRNPLRCNQRQVPDPFGSLVPPAYNPATSKGNRVVAALTGSGANNVVSALLSQISPLLQTLLSPVTGLLEDLLCDVTLEPGVYDSLTIVSLGGSVKLNAGIYVITDVSPITQMSLCILGSVEADGVMFYIAKPQSYIPLPSNLQPSVLIAPLIHTCTFRGLNNGVSPYKDLVLYQDPTDIRPMIIESQNLIGTGSFSGSIYNKSGHVTWVAGGGTYDMKAAAGTMRVVTVTNSELAPSEPFPAATSVMLLE